MNERGKILRHLDEDYTKPIRDPVWKHIYLSKPLFKIIQTATFQKLNGIKQLGPTYLIYPGATHTRFNHSLGVFHLARKMITQLVKKQNHVSISLKGVKGFLCASLLHDLGHYPFAHSLKDLNVKEHEALTAEKITNTPELSAIIQNDLKIAPEFIASIIDLDSNISSKMENVEDIHFFRNMLSGVLDPDKLDYLNRDAYFCGVPYGIQDIDFIFNEICIHPHKGIAISLKGLASVESILFSKYLMYRNVYWHNKIRIITAMIKKGILLGLNSGIIASDDLYGKDDQDFFSTMKSHIFLPFKLIESASRRHIYVPIYTIPFCTENHFHLTIEKLDERLKFESYISEQLSLRLGKEVKQEKIVIDIPERISFEIDLPVFKHNTEAQVPYRKNNVDILFNQYFPYNQSNSVFSQEVIKGFCRSLRYISLVCAPEKELLDELKKMDLPSLFHTKINK